MFNKLKKFFADTPGNYAEKPLANGIQAIPAGAVILTRSRGSALGYIIRKVTNGWTNHSAIYFGSGRHETVEALEHGPQISQLDYYLNKKSQFEVWVKRDLSVIQLAIIKGYAYGCCGKPYDWRNVLGFIFPFLKKQTDGKMDCSELVSKCYNAAGIKTTTKAYDQTAPDDLRDYFTSDAGKKDRWCLYDSFNIKR